MPDKCDFCGFEGVEVTKVKGTELYECAACKGPKKRHIGITDKEKLTYCTNLILKGQREILEKIDAITDITVKLQLQGPDENWGIKVPKELPKENP